MELLGLILEFVLLAVGVIMYLFSRGLYTISNEDKRKQVDIFVAKNKGWMRWLGLVLTAIMLINIYFHIVQMQNT